MNDLFNIPSDDPHRVARALEKLGNVSRRRMRKGKSYLTWEHRAAKIVRLWASGRSAPRVADQAGKLIHGLENRVGELQNLLVMSAALGVLGWAMLIVNKMVGF